MSHSVRMLIACLLPFLLIFLLPLLGISGGGTLWIFLIIFFAAHLWMLFGHRQGRGNGVGVHGEHDHGKTQR